MGESLTDFDQIRNWLCILYQSRHFGLGNAFDLSANLAHFGQRMREHFTNGVFKHTGIGGNSQVGKRSCRKQESAGIHVLRADTPVVSLIALLFPPDGLAFDQCAHGLKGIKVGLEE